MHLQQNITAEFKKKSLHAAKVYKVHFLISILIKMSHIYASIFLASYSAV